MQIQSAGALVRQCSPMRATGESPGHIQQGPLHRKSLSCDGSSVPMHARRAVSCVKSRLGMAVVEGSYHTDTLPRNSSYRFSSPIMSPRALIPLAPAGRALSALGRQAGIVERETRRPAPGGTIAREEGFHRRSCSDGIVKAELAGFSDSRTVVGGQWDGLRGALQPARANGRRTAEGFGGTKPGPLEVVAGPEARVKRTRRSSPQRTVAAPVPAEERRTTPEEVEIAWGDTLTSLSRRHACTVPDWVPRNPGRIRDVNRIYAGDSLRVPPPTCSVSMAEAMGNAGGRVVYASVSTMEQHTHRSSLSAPRAVSAPPSTTPWQPIDNAVRGAAESIYPAVDAARQMGATWLKEAKGRVARDVREKVKGVVCEDAGQDLLWKPLPKRRLRRAKNVGRVHGALHSPSEWFREARSSGVGWVKRVVVTTDENVSKPEPPSAVTLVAHKLKSGVSSITESVATSTSAAVTRIGEKLPPPFEGPRGVAVVASGAALIFAAMIAATHERQEAWREDARPAFRTRGDALAHGTSSPSGISPPPRFVREPKTSPPVPTTAYRAGTSPVPSAKAVAHSPTTATPSPTMSLPMHMSRSASNVAHNGTLQHKSPAKSEPANILPPLPRVVNPVLSFPVVLQPSSKMNTSRPSPKKAEAAASTSPVQSTQAPPPPRPKEIQVTERRRTARPVQVPPAPVATTARKPPKEIRLTEGIRTTPPAPPLRQVSPPPAATSSKPPPQEILLTERLRIPPPAPQRQVSPTPAATSSTKPPQGITLTPPQTTPPPAPQSEVSPAFAATSATKPPQEIKSTESQKSVPLVPQAQVSLAPAATSSKLAAVSARAVQPSSKTAAVQRSAEVVVTKPEADVAVAPSRFTSPPPARPRRSLGAFLRSRKSSPDLTAPGTGSVIRMDKSTSAKWRLPQLFAAAMKIAKAGEKVRQEGDQEEKATTTVPASQVAVGRLESMGLGRLGRAVREGGEVPEAEAGIVRAEEGTESVTLAMTKQRGVSAVATASASVVARATAVAVVEECVEFEVEDWVYVDEENGAATPAATPAPGAAAILNVHNGNARSRRSLSTEGLAAALGSPFFDQVSMDGPASDAPGPQDRFANPKPAETRQLAPSRAELDVQVADRPRPLNTPEFLRMPADVAVVAADDAVVEEHEGRRRVRVKRKMTERATAIASATATAQANATATAVAGVLPVKGAEREGTGVVESSSALYKGKMCVDVDSALVPEVDNRRAPYIRALQAATPAFTVGAGAMASLAGVDAALEVVGFAAMAGFIFSDVLWDDSRRQLLKSIESITDHKQLKSFLRQRKIMNED